MVDNIKGRFPAVKRVRLELRKLNPPTCPGHPAWLAPDADVTLTGVNTGGVIADNFYGNQVNLALFTGTLPPPDNSGSTPEPASLATLGVGTAVLLMRRRKRACPMRT